MSKTVHKIVKGAGIIFIGSAISIVLRILSKAIIARSVTVSDFGIYSLASVVFSIVFVFSLLGLEEGIPRQVAYFRGTSRVYEIISSSIVISTVSGITFSILLFFLSEELATFFNDKNLTIAIKLFSLALPFSVLASTILAIFRGFEMPEIRVYINDLFRNLIFIVLLFTVFIFRLSLIGVLISYVISAILAFICLVVILFKKIKFEFIVDKYLTFNLLKFSVPLLIAIILGMLMAWTDILMLGYFRESWEVGLYSASHSLAGLIPIFLSSAAYMYIPVASKIYSEGLMEELRRTYQIITKWVFSITIPFFVILILCPEFVLSLFFGSSYIAASDALRILALGFMFHVTLGLNGASLIVLGGGKLLMYMTTIGAISNIILNAMLIPKFGIVGASIATAISYILANTMASIKLFQISGIQPFTKNYIKILAISTVTLLIFMFCLLNVKIHTLSTVFAILMCTIYILAFLILIILLKCIDEEDIELIAAIEKRLGISFKFIKSIIYRLYR